MDTFSLKKILEEVENVGHGELGFRDNSRMATSCSFETTKDSHDLCQAIVNPEINSSETFPCKAVFDNGSNCDDSLFRDVVSPVIDKIICETSEEECNDCDIEKQEAVNDVHDECNGSSSGRASQASSLLGSLLPISCSPGREIGSPNAFHVFSPIATPETICNTSSSAGVIGSGRPMVSQKSINVEGNDLDLNSRISPPPRRSRFCFEYDDHSFDGTKDHGYGSGASFFDSPNELGINDFVQGSVLDEVFSRQAPAPRYGNDNFPIRRPGVSHVNSPFPSSTQPTQFASEIENYFQERSGAANVPSNTLEQSTFAANLAALAQLQFQGDNVSNNLVPDENHFGLSTNSVAGYMRREAFYGQLPRNEYQYRMDYQMRPSNVLRNDFRHTFARNKGLTFSPEYKYGSHHLIEQNFLTLPNGRNREQYQYEPPSQPVQESKMIIRCKIGKLGTGYLDFCSPHGFCIGRFEEVIIADTDNHCIKIFDLGGNFRHKFGSPGKEDGCLWMPRKVVIGASGNLIVCDRGGDRSRMQVFFLNGYFIKRINIHFIDIVAGLTINRDGHIVVIDSVKPTIFFITEETGEVIRYIECSHFLKEPSDIVYSGNEYFICDFKDHSVAVMSEDGSLLRKIGDQSVTPFPNGIDVSDEGDVLIGDSHGNEFHIAVYSLLGKLIAQFKCDAIKVSRCCGLKITSKGYVVTLAKNNHHLLILDTLRVA